MPPFIPLPLVIVAGGKSSRMGCDKALLPFGDAPTLTQFQFVRLKPFFKSLHVSTKSRDKFSFEASFIEDIDSFQERSPLIALLSILKHLHTPVCVLSVDTPFVSPEVFARLFTALKPGIDAVVARAPQGMHPLCAIYSPSLIPQIEAMLAHNKHKIHTLLLDASSVWIDFESDAPFLNLNHPEEYEMAKGLL